jgi:hypothetical protein
MVEPCHVKACDRLDKGYLGVTRLLLYVRCSDDKANPMRALSMAPSAIRASAEPSYLSHRGGFWVGHGSLVPI